MEREDDGQFLTWEDLNIGNFEAINKVILSLHKKRNFTHDKCKKDDTHSTINHTEVGQETLVLHVDKEL